jgi:hypothetical protein
LGKAPENKVQTWTYSTEELRASPFGEALLLIADCASGNGLIEKEQVQRSMQYVCRILFRDAVKTLPAQFQKTELGGLFSAASAQILVIWVPLRPILRCSRENRRET